MTFATDLRFIGFALALVTLIAGCNNALKPDDAAPKSATTATRSQPASTTSSASTGTPSRPASAATASLPAPASQPEPPPSPTALQIQLAEAIRLFDAGEFYAAAGRLRNLPDLNGANVETQLTAMKYLAFSYCVTNRRTLCQQQFEAALKVDPKFALAPAERGHPIWKVHFERAKLAVAKGSAPKGSDAAADKPGSAKKGGAKKGDAKTGDAKTSTAKTGDVKTAEPKKADAKTSASASKGSRKNAKEEPKASPAAVMDPRSSPDQKPQ